MVKSGNGSSRSKYNQRNRPNGGGNDFRNRAPHQSHRQNESSDKSNGYQRQSRFSNAPVNQMNGYNRPAPYKTQSRFDAAPSNGYGQPKQSYPQYQNGIVAHQQQPQMPMQMYSAPPSSIPTQFSYPPPVMPVKN